MKDANQFRVMTLNARGLRDDYKNCKMFNWIAKHNGHNSITFLQETHSSPEIENKWRNRWRGDIVFAHGDSSSRGVAILIGENLNIKINQRMLSSNGRYILLLCEIQEKPYILINYYAPNDELNQLILLKEIYERIDGFDLQAETEIIWGGDFNLFFDKDLEAFGGNPTKKFRSLETIQTILEELDMCDIWRVRNPTSRRFTWKGNRISNKTKGKETINRRLDFFFISNTCQASVIKK